MEKMKEKFSESYTDIFISQWNPPNSCFKAWISLKYSLLLILSKNLIISLDLKENTRLNHKISVACRSCRSCQPTSPIFPSSTQRISTKLHIYHHMGTILFINSISLYFNSLSSVQDVLKESQMVTSQWFEHGLKFF